MVSTSYLSNTSLIPRRIEPVGAPSSHQYRVFSMNDRSSRTVVQPARGDQADRRLHDIDRPVSFSELDRVRPGHRNDLHRFQGAPAVRLGAEIEPQRRIGIAGVALLDV